MIYSVACSAQRGLGSMQFTGSRTHPAITLQGGCPCYAQVYLARWRETPVAAKLMLDRWGGQGEQQQQRGVAPTAGNNTALALLLKVGACYQSHICFELVDAYSCLLPTAQCSCSHPCGV